MRLALDVGNTQTSFGVFDNSGLIHHWRMETKDTRSEDEHASFLFPLLDRQSISIGQIEAVVVCSVVPPLDRALRSFSQKYFGKEPFVISSEIDTGLTLKVDVPSQVGADRLANSAYAVSLLPLPAVVVDIGTGTTFDIITPDRCYHGGVILPGVRLAAEALGTKTSKLPTVDLQFPPSVIGRNTVDCIRSGILFGYLDLIDGLLDRVEKEIGKLGSIALTGGISPLFADRLRHHVRSLPNLTLEGIDLLYRKNRR